MQFAEKRTARRHRDACDQCGGVREVRAEVVTGFIGEPLAVAAADHVWADDPAIRLELASEEVEIAAIAREAVHADDNMPSRRITPVAVGNAMETSRAEAQVALS
jgi:hypothetical protein